MKWYWQFLSFFFFFLLDLLDLTSVATADLILFICYSLSLYVRWPTCCEEARRTWTKVIGTYRKFKPIVPYGLKGDHHFSTSPCFSFHLKYVSLTFGIVIVSFSSGQNVLSKPPCRLRFQGLVTLISDDDHRWRGHNVCRDHFTPAALYSAAADARLCSLGGWMECVCVWGGVRIWRAALTSLQHSVGVCDKIEWERTYSPAPWLIFTAKDIRQCPTAHNANFWHIAVN